VDRLYKDATSAKSADDAHAKFAEATKLIDQDVPALPIYFYSQQWGYSEKIKKVEVNWVGDIDLSSVELA
jgi:oligopeptide transport system substrate-binding protein